MPWLAPGPGLAIDVSIKPGYAIAVGSAFRVGWGPWLNQDEFGTWFFGFSRVLLEVLRKLSARGPGGRGATSTRYRNP